MEHRSPEGRSCLYLAAFPSRDSFACSTERRCSIPADLSPSSCLQLARPGRLAWSGLCPRRPPAALLSYQKYCPCLSVGAARNTGSQTSHGPVHGPPELAASLRSAWSPPDASLPRLRQISRKISSASFPRVHPQTPRAPPQLLIAASALRGGAVIDRLAVRGISPRGSH